MLKFFVYLNLCSEYIDFTKFFKSFLLQNVSDSYKQGVSSSLNTKSPCDSQFPVLRIPKYMPRHLWVKL